MDFLDFMGMTRLVIGGIYLLMAFLALCRTGIAFRSGESCRRTDNDRKNAEEKNWENSQGKHATLPYQGYPESIWDIQAVSYDYAGSAANDTASGDLYKEALWDVQTEVGGWGVAGQLAVRDDGVE